MHFLSASKSDPSPRGLLCEELEEYVQYFISYCVVDFLYFYFGSNSARCTVRTIAKYVFGK